MPTHLSPVFLGDRQLVHVFFEKKQNNDNSNITRCGLLKINKNVTKTRLQYAESNTRKDNAVLSKLTARAVMKELESLGVLLYLIPSSYEQKR